jgi:hypothetical protein
VLFQLGWFRLLGATYLWELVLQLSLVWENLSVAVKA